MTSRVKVFLIVLVTISAFGLVSGTRKSAATGQQSSLTTLRATGAVLETSEPINSISVSEDEQTLRVVSGLTGEVEAYRSAPDGWLRLLNKTSNLGVKRLDGDRVQVERGKVTVYDAAGKLVSRFASYPAISTALLNGGKVVVASPTEKNLLHVYSPDGQLLKSFGQVKRRDQTNPSQNSFLNRGRVLTDAKGNIYYVYGYVPLIQKSSPDGEMLYEIEVKGEAIELQQAVARQFLSIRDPWQVGGVDIINAAAVERRTGHLWIGMNGSSTSGVVYEYDGQGQKVGEYALRVNVPGVPPQNITNIKDIAVTGSSLYVLTSYQQVYSFNRKGDSVARLKQSLTIEPHPRPSFRPLSLLNHINLLRSRRAAAAPANHGTGVHSRVQARAHAPAVRRGHRQTLVTVRLKIVRPR